MGVFALHASNIRGFASARPVWIGPEDFLLVRVSDEHHGRFKIHMYQQFTASVVFSENMHGVSSENRANLYPISENVTSRCGLLSASLLC